MSDARSNNGALRVGMQTWGMSAWSPPVPAHLWLACYAEHLRPPLLCREQERMQRAEAARQETERILAEQQAAVDAKKADIAKREAEKEAGKAQAQAERAAANAEARARADARIAAALQQNRDLMSKRREVRRQLCVSRLLAVSPSTAYVILLHGCVDAHFCPVQDFCARQKQNKERCR